MIQTVLSSRERLTRLFNGQDIDRIPIWLLAPYHRLGCYADIYDLECYKPIVDAIDKYCDTFDRRGFNMGFCYNGNPEIKWEHSEEDNAGNHIIKDILRYKDMSLMKYVSTGKDGTKVKPLIEDVDELKKIVDIPYVPPSPDVSKFFREQEELGDKGLMMVDIGDPLMPLYNLTSAENFSLWTATDYDKILSFLDAIYDRVLYAYKYLLDRNVGDVFFIVGAEFAGPPLVSPTKFRDLSVRYVKGIVDLIRGYGKKSIVHYHGNLYKVLAGMKEINPDGLHTIEAPPIGDCTITQAREALGKDMVLIGNIQYDDLVRKDKDEIEQMIKDAIGEGKSGRFILSPTAGPYETFINEKTVENYLAFINAGIRYGRVE
ncbi:uroporphyrinogen decarboxylase family protein [Mahella australiensis]|nr:uroporphyrinogen decarboxylase family protein [Mahella australiensis]